MRKPVNFMKPLVTARVLEGLSQRDVADRLGISPMTVCTMEAGTKQTRMSIIARYAALFGLRAEITFVEDPSVKDEMGKTVDADVSVNDEF